MKHLSAFTSLLVICVLLFGCEGNSGLPVYGPAGEDSSYLIQPFVLINQDSQVIKNKDLKGKVVLVDFFFTSCPSICPKMKSNLLKVHEAMAKESDFMILSHTIDQKRDTVARLRDYAQKLGVDKARWQFVTAEKDTILSLAKSYLVSASEDDDAPGGFVHSGNFILLDRKGRIRAYYDGTLKESVPQILNDIHELLNEKL
jgi:protein SCO1/2